MDKITMMPARRVTSDTHVLPAWVPLPGYGFICVNAYVLEAAEPVLVDTGVPVLREAFMEQLRTVIDPAELRWLWLTHTDADHVGALDLLLEAAPRMRVVTSYLGLGRLGLSWVLPLERVFLLNPGQQLEVGDRQLLALRPPLFDAPETTMAFDLRTRTLFSSDFFGALVDQPGQASTDFDRQVLRDGMTLWATIDAPWVHDFDEVTLRGRLEEVRRLAPAQLLSAHLPPAGAMDPAWIEYLAAARTAPPFVGPDQAGLQAMLVG